MTDPTPAQVRWQQLTRPQQDAVVRLALLAVSAGPDLVVTLARRLLGRRGVQLGPAIAAIGVAAVAPPVGRWAFDHQSRVGGAALLGVGAAVVAAPVLGAIAPVTVVGRASPLWALAVSAAARGGLAGALAASVVRAGRRDVSRS